MQAVLPKRTRAAVRRYPRLAAGSGPTSTGNTMASGPTPGNTTLNGAIKSLFDLVVSDVGTSIGVGDAIPGPAVSAFSQVSPSLVSFGGHTTHSCLGVIWDLSLEVLHAAGKARVDVLCFDDCSIDPEKLPVFAQALKPRLEAIQRDNREGNLWKKLTTFRQEAYQEAIQATEYAPDVLRSEIEGIWKWASNALIEISLAYGEALKLLPNLGGASSAAGTATADRLQAIVREQAEPNAPASATTEPAGNPLLQVAPLPGSDVAAGPMEQTGGDGFCVTIDQIAKLANVAVKTVQNKLSAGGTSSPKPATERSGSRAATFRYSDIRPWLLGQWPNRSLFFPEAVEEVRQFLKNGD